MANINELTITVNASHRIRGLFRAGFIFIGMAIKEMIHTRPARKSSKTNLNFQINIDVSIERIANELYRKQSLQGDGGGGITPN